MSDTYVQTGEATSNSGVTARQVAPTVSVGPILGSKDIKVAPRLYHKKSRSGCQRCRARRVKVYSLFRLGKF